MLAVWFDAEWKEFVQRAAFRMVPGDETLRDRVAFAAASIPSIATGVTDGW
jgi:hypothetical protein